MADEGIILTPGLVVYVAPRSAVRDDDIFVSVEDAPVLIQKLSDILATIPANPDMKPDEGLVIDHRDPALVAASERRPVQP